MFRTNINLQDGFPQFTMTMCEGNPGAMNVLFQLMEDKSMGCMLVLNLDDMNIRGTQIWIGYKDFCGEDIKKFKQCIVNRDDTMIARINEEGLRGNHNHKAVKAGASYDNREFLD